MTALGITFEKAPDYDLKTKNLLLIVYIVITAKRCIDCHSTVLFRYPLCALSNILQSHHTTLRSFSISAMSKCGLLLVAPVRLKHRALCRLLASWFRDGRTHLICEDSFSLREHRRTSFTSPSIFFERMVGNTALTRSSILFLKAMLRQTRFNRNIPGPIAERSRNKSMLNTQLSINILTKKVFSSSVTMCWKQHTHIN